MLPHASPAQVHVHVFEQFQLLVSERFLRSVVESALATEEDLGGRGDVSVVIADDETVRELNRRHRGLDESTDVLSFSFIHQGEYYGDGEAPISLSETEVFAMPPGQPPGLGEVIVSYPQAVRQAEESPHTLDQELASLLAHGVLHLLGYDHAEPEDGAVMRSKETAVLARVVKDE